MSVFVVVLCLVAVANGLISPAVVPRMVHGYVERPMGYTKLGTSRQSTLYQIELPSANSTTPGQSYDSPPLLVTLRGTRHDIGYDYAALLHEQTSYTFRAFMDSVIPSAKDQLLLMKFIDYCWDNWLSKHTPASFLEELQGMQDYYKKNGISTGNSTNVPAYLVSQRFYTLANLPADGVNIIAMLENEFEQGWPQWLKTIVNDLIKILEKIIHTCDAYGVWGSRTVGGLLYSSRNLDYNSNTGINRYKLVIVYDIREPGANVTSLPGGVYSSLGFSDGLGALAGISQTGLTTSEMNLDNSVVTFNGVPFPLRLRMVLEQGTDLQSAMEVWNSTNNTNSFNFLIASAPDALKGNTGAYALETIRNYTGVFPDNSPVEAAATYNCPNTTCHKWTNQSGVVRIGKPLPEAVWRSNHGMNPVVMATQEPLFNDTVFRYDLMHQLFSELEDDKSLIDDTTAVGIVATLGIKGVDFFSCNQDFRGDNVMSIAYAPGPRASQQADSQGHFYIAWESGSGASWRPAACSPYVRIDLKDWIL